jgi:hypothetical protein
VIPWIIIAVIAVPLVVIAFAATRRNAEQSRSSLRQRPTKRSGMKKTRADTTRSVCPSTELEAGGPNRKNPGVDLAQGGR